MLRVRGKKRHEKIISIIYSDKYISHPQKSKHSNWINRNKFPKILPRCLDTVFCTAACVVSVAKFCFIHFRVHVQILEVLLNILNFILHKIILVKSSYSVLYLYKLYIRSYSGRMLEFFFVSFRSLLTHRHAVINCRFFFFFGLRKEICWAWQMLLYVRYPLLYVYLFILMFVRMYV